MQTEFTCGIYTVIVAPNGWIINKNGSEYGVIDEFGEHILIQKIDWLNGDELIEILTLMNNIKRQYKQLQTT